MLFSSCAGQSSIFKFCHSRTVLEEIRCFQVNRRPICNKRGLRFEKVGPFLNRFCQSFLVVCRLQSY